MSRDLEQVGGYAELAEGEEALLSGVERPIVLVAKRENSSSPPW